MAKISNKTPPKSRRSISKSRINHKISRHTKLNSKTDSITNSARYLVKVANHRTASTAKGMLGFEPDLSFATDDYISNMNLSPIAKANVRRVIRDYNLEKGKKK